MSCIPAAHGLSAAVPDASPMARLTSSPDLEQPAQLPLCSVTAGAGSPKTGLTPSPGPRFPLRNQVPPPSAGAHHALAQGQDSNLPAWTRPPRADAAVTVSRLLGSRAPCGVDVDGAWPRRAGRTPGCPRGHCGGGAPPALWSCPQGDEEGPECSPGGQHGGGATRESQASVPAVPSRPLCPTRLR